jgi:hypothetical protein
MVEWKEHIPLIFPIKIFNRSCGLRTLASLGWLGNEFNVFLSHSQTAWLCSSLWDWSQRAQFYYQDSLIHCLRSQYHTTSSGYIVTLKMDINNRAWLLGKAKSTGPEWTTRRVFSSSEPFSWVCILVRNRNTEELEPEARAAAAPACLEGGNRPGPQRRSAGRWRPSPVRCGKLKGYERVASTHRERVECAAVAVGSVGWWESCLRLGPCAVGQGRWVQAGLFPAGSARESLLSGFSFLPSAFGFPAEHSPVASRGVCARLVQFSASLTWRWLLGTLFCLGSWPGWAAAERGGRGHLGQRWCCPAWIYPPRSLQNK